MIADIQPPDVETRIAILKARNEELKLNVPLDVLVYIANQSESNIRELQAQLLQAVTKARSLGQEITVSTASGMINNLEREKQLRVTPNKIIREVAKYYGVTVKDIKGKSRQKPFVMPRQITMYLLRHITDTGYQSIGGLLGNRDHTTIMHGVDKIDLLLGKNVDIKREISQLKENILVN